MLLVKGNRISFSYKTELEYIIENVSFTINSKSKIGIVGKNGSGKSTLIKLITGELECFQGDIQRFKEVRIGYLPQELIMDEDMLAADYLWSLKDDLFYIRKKIINDDDPYLYAEYEEYGGYQFEILIEKLRGEMNLDETLLNRKISLLSGGEKTKLALMRILLDSPDLILFDEPTNHLDLDTLNWLETYLREIKIPFLMISHDRAFLDECVNEIWEVKDLGLRTFSGNYSFYKKKIKEEYDANLLKYEIQQKKIKQLTKTLNQRKGWALTFQKETGTDGNAPVYECVTNQGRRAMKRAKNIEKRIEMIIEKEQQDKPWIDKRKHLKFNSQGQVKGKIALEIYGLKKAYSRELFSDLNLRVTTGSRLGLMGPNSSGKTTLLRILLGEELADAGEFRFSPQVRIAYYAQGYDNLDFDHTVLEEVASADKDKQEKARTILACMGIKGELIYQKVSSLSAGERSKVSLVKAVLSGANLLILDEPTNHLEIDARVALENALKDFDGTILFVSHDRMFVENIATEIFELG